MSWSALKWADADLDAGVLTLAHTILELGGRLSESTPMTAGSERRIYLDAGTAEVLRQHCKAQLSDRLRAGTAWEACNPDFAP